MLAWLSQRDWQPIHTVKFLDPLISLYIPIHYLLFLSSFVAPGIILVPYLTLHRITRSHPYMCTLYTQRLYNAGYQRACRGIVVLGMNGETQFKLSSREDYRGHTQGNLDLCHIPEKHQARLGTYIHTYIHTFPGKTPGHNNPVPLYYTQMPTADTVLYSDVLLPIIPRVNWGRACRGYAEQNRVTEGSGPYRYLPRSQNEYFLSPFI